MLRMSDILNKAKKQEKSKEKFPVEQPLKVEALKPIPEVKQEPEPIKPAPVQAKQSEEAHQSFMHFAPQEKKTPETGLNEQEVIRVYREGIPLVKEIIGPFSGPDSVRLIKESESFVRKIVDILRKDEKHLLKLFFDDYDTEKGYLYQHTINVCVLALKIGFDLNYDFIHLCKLGMAALVHDIGMVQVDEFAGQPRQLSKNEHDELKKHPVYGLEILKSKFGQQLDFELLDVIRQEHERNDGSGYPYGIKSNDICEYAKLIGVIDTYEAIQHTRPYRNKLGCLATMKRMLEKKDVFEQKFIKDLIDNIGIFPVGTFVQLNTDEIGVVVTQTPKMPLRPWIDITHDANKQKLAEAKRVDLSGNFSIYIKDCYIEPKG